MTTPEETLTLPGGARLRLRRHPHRPGQPLRAWDAADEMVLAHLAEQPAADGATTLVLNDAWGALVLGLDGLRPTAVLDSEVARRALAGNCDLNGMPAERAVVATVGEGPAEVDLAVLKLPKSGDRLNDQLHALAPRLADGARLVTAGMTRHVHRSTLEALERLIGPTVTTRAVRKARLALTTRDGSLDPGPSPWPTRWEGPEGLVVVHHAGVFGQGRIDAGTRLLLAHLPAPGAHGRVVDLGCGDGVIGTVVGQRDPHAEVTFVDESDAAVRSAAATWRATLGERPMQALVGDGLRGVVSPGRVDLVLCNPPFHHDHVLAEDLARRLVADAHQALRPGGELRVVGNRHLRHDQTLRRHFGSVEVVASDPRFVVVRATKPG